MLDKLIIEDEELRQRILTTYSVYDIIDLMGLSIEEILDTFWDKVQENPGIFEDVLTELDYYEDYSYGLDGEQEEDLFEEEEEYPG
jgi:hypothetical protein